MQNPSLKLKEIIWEITGRCNNNCRYCGSKNVQNVEIDEDKIIRIAEKIAEYPPESINISGGDPLLVSYDTHEKIVNIFNKAGIVCKILANPKSYKNINKNRKVTDLTILDLYSVIGLSVNETKEIELAEKFLTYKNKITIISNFNLENIFLFDKIKEVVKKFSNTWQIQFTMYNDKEVRENERLYTNKAALEMLQSYVDIAVNEGVNIIPADNMNNGRCSAGTHSCGILYDGSIIPCLSMRSWCNTECIIQGNLNTDSFKDIWLNSFNKYRFDKYECCKDKCNNKIIQIRNIVASDTTPDVSKIEYYEIYPMPESDPNAPPTTPTITVYGVYPNNYPMLYGVFPNTTTDTRYTITGDKK